MKIKTLVAIALAGALGQFALPTAQAQNIDAMAPVVVKTFPEAGTKDVAPGVVEIKVMFSKEMKDHSWSWSTAWKDSSPEVVEKPHYDADKKTCIIKVKLEPNKTYGYWLNSENFHNFKDSGDHSAVPYLLTFQTKAE